MRRSTRSRRTRPTKPGKVRERPVAETNPQQLFARLAAEGAMIASLAADSRRCAPGVAFFAYPGETADGRSHIPDASVRGLRNESGRFAHEFYGQPSQALWTCGITGTNGKTSCSHWLAALL